MPAHSECASAAVTDLLFALVFTRTTVTLGVDSGPLIIVASCGWGWIPAPSPMQEAPG